MFSTPPLRAAIRSIGRRRFDFSRQIVVMGIINRTSDSFYDRGRTFALDAAVSAALAVVDAGAAIVDIGGIPFSPDTAEVSAAEEIDRVLPVIEAVRGSSDVVISIDTFRAEVAAASLRAGADMINDTSSLSDEDLAGVVVDGSASLVITHSLALPRTHLHRPQYGDVVTEVRNRLQQRVEYAVSLGVPEDKIIIDPGHDLNKTTRHSLEITARLDEIAALGLPLLAAVSNKDFIGEATGLAKPERGAASIATATVCALQGARILRMHDVPAAVGAAIMVESILGFRDPAYERHNL